MKQVLVIVGSIVAGMGVLVLLKWALSEYRSRRGSFGAFMGGGFEGLAMNHRARFEHQKNLPVGCVLLCVGAVLFTLAWFLL